MKVKDIMHSATRISASTTISKAAEIMDKKSIGSVLVEEYGNVIGIMTERDIMRKIVAKGKNPDYARAKEVMSRTMITIEANDDVLEASRIMGQSKTGWLIVVDKGEIIGKVTAESISSSLKYALVSHPSRSQDDYLIR